MTRDPLIEELQELAREFGDEGGGVFGAAVERITSLLAALERIAATTWPPGYSISAAHSMIDIAREAIAATRGGS